MHQGEYLRDLATFGSRYSVNGQMAHVPLCIVEVLKSGTCKNELIMDLVRHLFYISALYNFELLACYLNMNVNRMANALSRLQFNRFRALAPGAEQQMMILSYV